jgi:hypothetical protein
LNGSRYFQGLIECLAPGNPARLPPYPLLARRIIAEGLLTIEWRRIA